MYAEWFSDRAGSISLVRVDEDSPDHWIAALEKEEDDEE